MRCLMSFRTDWFELVDKAWALTNSLSVGGMPARSGGFELDNENGTFAGGRLKRNGLYLRGFDRR